MVGLALGFGHIWQMIKTWWKLTRRTAQNNVWFYAPLEFTAVSHFISHGAAWTVGEEWTVCLVFIIWRCHKIAVRRSALIVSDTVCQTQLMQNDEQRF